MGVGCGGAAWSQFPGHGAAPSGQGRTGRQLSVKWGLWSEGKERSPRSVRVTPFDTASGKESGVTVTPSLALSPTPTPRKCKKRLGGKWGASAGPPRLRPSGRHRARPAEVVGLQTATGKQQRENQLLFLLRPISNVRPDFHSRQDSSPPMRGRVQGANQ